MYPGLPMPPEPVITRWGTWLNAAIYYCNHFSAVKSVIDTFDDEDAEAIDAAKRAFSHADIETDLAYIKCNFSSLVSATVKLETQGLALSESIGIISTIQNSLDDLDRGEFGEKFGKVLKRNGGFKQIVDINNIINKNMQATEAHAKKLTPKELTLFKYAPTTTTDVEKSFSDYKHLFSDRRRKFLFENLKHHMIAYCNRDI